MTQIWRSTLASFYLMGFAGITTAAAISSSAVDADARTVAVREQGQVMMIDAQYDLARTLRR